MHTNRIYRIAAIVLSISMLVGMFAVLPVSVAAATPIEPAAAFAGGDGTEANPYQISNGAELALLQAKIADGEQAANYYNKSYVLTADIVLNTGDATTWGSSAPANSFTAIGTWSNATSSFGGHFNGQGHTISGLYISTSNDGQGLFGVIQGGAVIENFALVNSYISATGATGAIIGQTDRASGDDITVSNVYTNATVVCSGKDEVGGIIGNLSNSKADDTFTAGRVTVDRATFVGSVSGKNYIAGIIGNARNVGVTITNCLVYASIRGSGSHVAGIMAKGKHDEGKTPTGANIPTVANCVVAGTEVTSTASTKYNMAYVSQNSATEAYKTKVENCYDASGLADDHKVRNANTTDCEDISVNQLYGFYAEADAIDWATWGGSDWASPNYDLVRPKGVAENFEIFPAQQSENGDGTAMNPYQIANADDLAVLSDRSQYDSFAGVYFELTADIVLTGTNNHTPIGTWACGFGGNFNGNGHTISGLHISSSSDGQGLFGVIQGGAVIGNFALVDSYIACTTGGATSAVIGQTNRGNEGDITIRNIYTNATVSCHGTEVGGIIGNISNSKSGYHAGAVTITGCVFDGKIESTAGYCGGIIGNARNVTVNLTNCANYGTVTATGRFSAGLLVTQDGAYSITNCISAGTVKTGYQDVYAIASGSLDKADGERTIASTYMLNGVAANGIARKADSTGGVTILGSVTDLLGTGATAPVGWTKRAGDLPVPSGLASLVASKQLFTAGLQNGASVRLDTPTGLRFTGVLSKAYLASLANVAGYGVVIAPTQYVETAGAFTIAALEAIDVASGSKYLKIPAVNLLENNSDYAAFTGVIGNIREENYSVSFSAIVYVEFENGDIIYSAYEETVNSRSVAHIARLAHEDVTEASAGDYTNAVNVPGATAKLYSPYSTAMRTTLENFYRNEKEIRVLQQNLLRDPNNEKGLGTHAERSYRFLKEVVKYDPDIIFLQEVDKEGDWYNYALKNLTGYTVVGVNSNTFYHRPIYDDYPNAPAAYIPIVLYRTERFGTTGSSGIFWLTNTPDTKGTQTFEITVGDNTGTYQQNTTRPSCYVNLVDHNNGDAAFTCASLHFSTNNVTHKSGAELAAGDAGSGVRRAEAAILLNYLEGKAGGNPILFGGDLNDTVSSKAIKYFKDEGYRNVYENTPENVGGQEVTTSGGSHIDWCFYGKDDFTPVSYRVITDQYLNKSGNASGYVSDHRGVISDIVMN